MIMEKIVDMIEKYNMIDNGDSIIVGLSGGPDSVCLLHALSCLKQKYNIKLYSAHVNHMLRGEEALRDENFARGFSEKLNIRFFSRSIRILEYAKENGLSTEEAGRQVRYNFFDEVLKETSGNKIALAHNMNDQAETMLMRFMRGTGISGIGGIKPVRDKKFIRPILSCTRQEIENYCEINALKPVIDSSNKENIYTRNRIRLQVIPYIKKYFNPNITAGLFKMSEILRDDDDYLDLAAKHVLLQIKQNKGNPRVVFSNLHISIKRRIIRLLIHEVKRDLNGIESKHIDECIMFIESSGTGKSINLPQGIQCIIEYDFFRIDNIFNWENYEFLINIPGLTRIKEEYTIVTEIHEICNKNLTDKQYVKYFDYDKIGEVVYFRNRREGDYIYPKGMSGCKKLKDLFIDKKITKDKRKEIPLVTVGNEVLWVLNIRDSRNYKPDSDTRRVLEVKIGRGGENR